MNDQEIFGVTVDVVPKVIGRAIYLDSKKP
jgi:hypothetical protein